MLKWGHTVKRGGTNDREWKKEKEEFKKLEKHRKAKITRKNIIWRHSNSILVVILFACVCSCLECVFSEEKYKKKNCVFSVCVICAIFLFRMQQKCYCLHLSRNLTKHTKVKSVKRKSVKGLYTRSIFSKPQFFCWNSHFDYVSSNRRRMKTPIEPHDATYHENIYQTNFYILFTSYLCVWTLKEHGLDVYCKPSKHITTNFTLIIITVIQVIAALQYFDVNMTQTNTQIVQLMFVRVHDEVRGTL